MTNENTKAKGEFLTNPQAFGGFGMNKSDMMILPIKYGNRALAKEEALDYLIENGVIEPRKVVEAVKDNPAYSKILKEEYKDNF
ncbi:phage protein [Streptococcus sobrinus]|nr:phage protein [Streptococcus sobrinus DSM 20742 = ATCC 33478]SQG14267.1 phage protein [Streptococcus sobrinus]